MSHEFVTGQGGYNGIAKIAEGEIVKSDAGVQMSKGIGRQQTWISLHMVHYSDIYNHTENSYTFKLINKFFYFYKVQRK